MVGSSMACVLTAARSNSAVDSKFLIFLFLMLLSAKLMKISI